jgi:hypothetical protein
LITALRRVSPLVTGPDALFPADDRFAA